MEHEIIELKRELADIKGMLAELLGKKRNPEMDQYVSLESAAEMSGIAVKTLRNYMSNGKLRITTKKFGQRVSLHRESFNDWMLDRMIMSRA